MKKIIMLVMVVLGTTLQAQEFDFSCEDEVSTSTYSLQLNTGTNTIGVVSHTFSSDDLTEVADLVLELSENFIVTAPLEAAGDFTDPSFMNGVEFSLQPIAINDTQISLKVRLVDGVLPSSEDVSDTYMLNSYVGYLSDDALIQRQTLEDLYTQVDVISDRVDELEVIGSVEDSEYLELIQKLIEINKSYEAIALESIDPLNNSLLVALGAYYSETNLALGQLPPG